MRTVLARCGSSYLPADFTKYASDSVCSDEIDSDFIILKRRYTRKLDSIALSDICAFDKNQHSKTTKSSIQSLELSAKNDLAELISTIPVTVESVEIDRSELDQICFVGNAKPIEGGLG